MPVDEFFTNLGVRLIFDGMIYGWFAGNISDYNDFIKALLIGDTDAMNDVMLEPKRQEMRSYWSLRCSS